MATKPDTASEMTKKNANSATSSRVLPSEPYLRSGERKRFVQAEWLIALIPIFLWAIFLFGLYALLSMLFSMACCLAADAVIRYLRIQKGESIARFDLTPAVIGLFISFLLPSDGYIWIAILAAVIAAGVGGLFGGMSASPLCLPALAICIVRAIFPSQTDITLQIDSEGGQRIADLLKAGEKPQIEIIDLLLGRNDGMIGEVASLLILLAAAYLIFRKQISWHIPLAWIVGGAITAYLTAPETMSVYYYTGAQLLTGGFMLVGCLIVPHRSTAPITAKAGMVVGVLGGVLTIFFRNQFGIDGALLAALIVSLPARTLDRMLAPVPFGGRRK